jgi:hypothetical protein
VTIARILAVHIDRKHTSDPGFSDDGRYLLLLAKLANGIRNAIKM